jgi:DMSO reductase family type II enzyme chaperone
MLPKIETDPSMHLRQMAYSLLANLFLYPGRERLLDLQLTAKVMLANSTWQESSFSPSFEGLLTCLLGVDLESDYRAIINEYNRLFNIRPKAPLHETYYLDNEGSIRGLQTARLDSEYLEAGLRVSTELNELPDHIAVELEFMSFLCSQENQATLAKDATHYRMRQRSFMDAHLARWFPKMAHRVKQAEPEHLYALVVQTVYAYLLSELDYLGIR